MKLDYNEILSNYARSGIIHCDANETVAFSRQLEWISSQAYEILYGELKARTFLPVNNSIDQTAEFHTYYQYDRFGAAEIVHVHANDFPSVEVNGTKTTSGIVDIGASYQYSLDELRRASRLQVNPVAMKAVNVRMAIEEKLEIIACTGDTATSISGFANASNISSETVTGAWSGLTAAQILVDINKMQKNVFVNTLGRFTPDTLILPIAEYARLSTTRIDDFNQTSILQHILLQSPWLKSIDFWPMLTTAGSGGVTRAICYKKDPMVAELMIPLEFEQTAPEVRNMAFVVNCRMKCGGVAVRYPKAICYMDGV